MKEALTLTNGLLDAGLLKRENYALETQKLIRQWYYLKDMNDLVAFHGCDDARVGDGVSIFGNPGIISIRSIAAANVYGGDQDFFSWVYKHPSVRGIVVAGHLDCGGLKEKKKIPKEAEDGQSRKTQSVTDYVRRLIVNEDPLKQAIISAMRTAEIVDKPVTAGLIDHSNLRFYPAMLIEDRGRKIRTEVSFEKLISSANQDLYENGVPELSFDLSIPEWLFSLQHNNQEVVADLPEDFSLGQQVQDPHTVAISTEIRPLSIRYPDTFKPTNSVFTVTLPYSKDDGGGVDITGRAVEQAFAQAEYPLSHAINAENGQGFFNTRNILIETPNQDLSKTLAERLLQKSWVSKWLEARRGQILVAQVNGGETNFLEKFQTV